MLGTHKNRFYFKISNKKFRFSWKFTWKAFLSAGLGEFHVNILVAVRTTTSIWVIIRKSAAFLHHKPNHSKECWLRNNGLLITFGLIDIKCECVWMIFTIVSKLVPFGFLLAFLFYRPTTILKRRTFSKYFGTIRRASKARYYLTSV